MPTTSTTRPNENYPARTRRRNRVPEGAGRKYNVTSPRKITPTRRKQTLLVYAVLVLTALLFLSLWLG